jgi:hypothetical protein
LLKGVTRTQVREVEKILKQMLANDCETDARR